MPDISAESRRLVASRAGFCCEYCGIAEDDSFLGCEVDHIVSRKHGGSDEVENLAYACTPCNRAKGTDLGSLDDSGRLVRFFNPRIDQWNDHLRVHDTLIETLTNIGAATARILDFNSPERIAERAILMRQGRYPR